MMKFVCIPLLLAAIIVWSGSVGAQSPDRRQLDSLLQCGNRKQLPGFAVRILSGNDELYQYACGNANVRKQLPMSQQTVSNIGSVTKQFTAYGIYLLEERGIVDTRLSVHTYLPELPDFGYRITLQHLLAHTSGLRDYPDLIALLNQQTHRALRYEPMVDFLHKHRELNFAPGERFCYSNTGYMLLARVIERVSGSSYANFLQQEIFEPLGMETAFVNEQVLGEQPSGTHCYRLNPQRTKATKSPSYRDALGATGVFCSLDDLSKWNRLFTDHEQGNRFSAIIARMETPFTLNDGSNCHYGGGLILKNYRGERVVEHSGGWGEYLTQYRRFPEKGITIMVITNSMLDSPFEICDRISNLLISFNGSVIPDPLVTEDVLLSNLNGSYISADNIIRHVTGDDLQQRLHVYNSGKTACSVYTLHHVESLADQTMGLFFNDSSGNALLFRTLPDSTRAFIWNAGTYFQTKRVYTAVPAFRFTDPAFAGRYFSKEMNRTVKIHYKKSKDRLVVVLFRFFRYPLEPVAQNVYQVSIDDDPYLLRFDSAGFVFGNDWVYNIRVVRKR